MHNLFQRNAADEIFAASDSVLYPNLMCIVVLVDIHFPVPAMACNGDS